jgi:hypothetical protein
MLAKVECIMEGEILELINGSFLAMIGGIAK